MVCAGLVIQALYPTMGSSLSLRSLARCGHEVSIHGKSARGCSAACRQFDASKACGGSFLGRRSVECARPGGIGKCAL